MNLATVRTDQPHWYWAECGDVRVLDQYACVAWMRLEDEMSALGKGPIRCDDPVSRALIISSRPDGLQWFCERCRGERTMLRDLPVRIVPGWIQSIYARRSAEKTR